MEILEDSLQAAIGLTLHACWNNIIVYVGRVSSALQTAPPCTSPLESELRDFTCLVQKLARRAAASSENNSMMPSVSLFTKKLSEEDVRILFDTADVYVHPSRSEGYGIGIAESMARGVPVILPEHGSPLDFVPNWTSFMFPASRCDFSQQFVCVLDQDLMVCVGTRTVHLQAARFDSLRKAKRSSLSDFAGWQITFA